jgi:hypothetical protein
MNRHDEQFELDAELRDLDTELSRAMPAKAPSGLSERIFAATAHELPAPGEGPAVVGRIGPCWQRWVGFAAAAGISLALTVAIWLGAQTGTDPGTGASGGAVTAGELTDTELTHIALALDAEDSQPALSEELDDLEADLEALATVWGDQSNTANTLYDDLSNLESQLRQF